MAQESETLQEWLANQCEVTSRPVRLPVSGRQYAIALPTDESREQLFAAAKAAGKVLPHWSRVWASGVALADLALARRGDLTGRPVLELGSGLGVTAAAAVEAGANLVAVDVVELALGFCRFNARSNAGRTPETVCLDWRQSIDNPAIGRIAGSDGYPVILAADVLYESRDIAPLIALIDRWLTPHGELWLVEPGRRTAQRFLSHLALAGWQGESTVMHGPWPDGTSAPIYVHCLSRPDTIDWLRSSIGGWRI